MGDRLNQSKRKKTANVSDEGGRSVLERSKVLTPEKKAEQSRKRHEYYLKNKRLKAEAKSLMDNSSGSGNVNLLPGGSMALVRSVGDTFDQICHAEARLSAAVVCEKSSHTSTKEPDCRPIVKRSNDETQSLIDKSPDSDLLKNPEFIAEVNSMFGSTLSIDKLSRIDATVQPMVVRNTVPILDPSLPVTTDDSYNVMTKVVEFPSSSASCSTNVIGSDNVCVEDVLAAVVDVLPVRKVNISNRLSSVQEILLVDQTLKPISLTLWDQFVDYEGLTLRQILHEFVVIVATRVRVTSYKGVSLSTKSSSSILINPDFDEANDLRSWAFWYMSCNECNRRTLNDYKKNFVCANCDSNRAIAQPRSRVEVEIDDSCDFLNATLFREQADAILECDAFTIMVYMKVSGHSNISTLINMSPSQELYFQLKRYMYQHDSDYQKRPLFASSLLSIIHSLLDQTRQDEMRIIDGWNLHA